MSRGGPDGEELETFVLRAPGGGGDGTHVIKYQKATFYFEAQKASECKNLLGRSFCGCGHLVGGLKWQITLPVGPQVFSNIHRAMEEESEFSLQLFSEMVTGKI